MTTSMRYAEWCKGACSRFEIVTEWRRKVKNWMIAQCDTESIWYISSTSRSKESHTFVCRHRVRWLSKLVNAKDNIEYGINIRSLKRNVNVFNRTTSRSYLRHVLCWMVVCIWYSRKKFILCASIRSIVLLTGKVILRSSSTFDKVCERYINVSISHLNVTTECACLKVIDGMVSSIRSKRYNRSITHHYRYSRCKRLICVMSISIEIPQSVRLVICHSSRLKITPVLSTRNCISIIG